MASKHDTGELLIGIGKLIKTVLLVVGGIMGLKFLNYDPPQFLQNSPRLFNAVMEKIAHLSDGKLAAISFGSFVYAALFAVEGTGLLLQKHWAKWLTIIITVSFIPLEVYEIAKEPGAGKIITLILNVAVVVYLVVRLRKDKAHRGRGFLDRPDRHVYGHP
jgi:uncharacterized membrane protein (DUF2068 family)